MQGDWRQKQMEESGSRSVDNRTMVKSAFWDHPNLLLLGLRTVLSDELMQSQSRE